MKTTEKEKYFKKSRFFLRQVKKNIIVPGTKTTIIELCQLWLPV